MALKAVTLYRLYIGLIPNYVKVLNKFGRRNRVTLGWLADQPARGGSQSKFIGQDLFVNFFYNTVKNAFQDYVRKERQREWTAGVGYRHSKEYVYIT